MKAIRGYIKDTWKSWENNKIVIDMAVLILTLFFYFRV